MQFLKNNKVIFALFLLSLLLTYNYSDFTSSMSVGTGHAYSAKSLVLSPNFNLNDYWGNAGEDTMLYKGNHYLPYAPLNAVIMAIPYFFMMILFFIFVHILQGTLDGHFSVLFESLALSLPSSLAFVGILLLIKKYTISKLNLSKFQSAILLASIGMGTILFIYSVSFFNHIISALFILSAYYMLTSNYKKKYLFGGIFVGLAFLTEFPTILFCVGVLIAELFQLKRKKINLREFFNNLSRFAIPVAISILLMLLYNYINFDHPFTFGEHVFKEYRRANDETTYGFTQNPLRGLYESLFSPLKGVFIYSPFLLMGILGLRSFIRENKYGSPILFSYLIIIPFVYAYWDDCYGASAYGNRYLMTILPFLGILLCYAAKTIYKLALLKVLFFALVVLSISLHTTNTIFGIADGKMGECHLFITEYNPYIRAINNLAPEDGTIGTAPAIIEFFNNED